MRPSDPGQAGLSVRSLPQTKFGPLERLSPHSAERARPRGSGRTLSDPAHGETGSPGPVRRRKVWSINVRNPAGTGGAREPKHDASTLRAWQGQPLDGQRVAIRHVMGEPGRIVRRSAIFWPRTIATFRANPTRSVLATASPRPMLVAIAPLGEMVMENKTTREQRQAMLLLIVQTRIKRRRQVRDRLQILAPRHCAFAAVPQPVNETCGLGLILEFFTPLHGALRGSARRGLDGGPELLLVRRQFQTGMEGGNARVKESGAIGGRENMLFRLGEERWQGVVARGR